MTEDEQAIAALKDSVAGAMRLKSPQYDGGFVYSLNRLTPKEYELLQRLVQAAA